MSGLNQQFTKLSARKKAREFESHLFSLKISEIRKRLLKLNCFSFKSADSEGKNFNLRVAKQKFLEEEESPHILRRLETQ